MQPEFDLTSLKDVKKIIELYKKWRKALSSKDFHDYIEKKCLTILNDLTGELLLNNSKYAGVYMQAHKAKVEGDKLTISNDAIVSLSQILAENYTESSRIRLAENYADGFDLAKAVEYGTGIVGASSAASAYASQDDWNYDVNNHGEKGWFYKSDGNVYWTKGYTGTLIYERAIQRIDEEIDDWIAEYLENIK